GGGRARPARGAGAGAVGGGWGGGGEAGPGGGAKRVEGLHFPVERLHEEEAAHLAVADDVDPRALLVANGELGGVVERLLDVGLAVLAGLDLVEGGPKPAGKAVASHHVRRDRRHRSSHAPFLSEGPTVGNGRDGPGHAL